MELLHRAFVVASDLRGHNSQPTSNSCQADNLSNSEMLLELVECYLDVNDSRLSNCDTYD